MKLLGPKRHTDRMGDVSEAAIAARLLQAGYVVLTPYGKQHRYDLVIEDRLSILPLSVKPQTRCTSFQ